MKDVQAFTKDCYNLLSTHTSVETEGKVIAGSKMGGANQSPVWDTTPEPNYRNETTSFPTPHRVQAGSKDKDYRSTVLTGSPGEVRVR